ncbi:MAG TPA: 1-(5-phosphoribosyl)-5-[(5-phosphoribosylamino)methylideneamino] imidazole-4-carboxamide isomerase [Bryobacteraceae bacterium]|jgi:phosphoribosylformimino-5-aminoimidazole carboxamide ribotide isomerase
MIIPCIDLMDGKVVQLVQGRDKALEGDEPLEMLRRFAAFPEIQVIDLNAAIGNGENSDIIESLASGARCRVGGGVRTPERARRLIEQGAHRLIIGTAAFTPALEAIAAAVGPEKIVVALDSKDGKIVVKGWREATDFTAEHVISRLEPFCSGFLCTYVDKEGMMQGTDLDWFRRLRAATSHELTAAGGITTMEDIRELHALGVHAALGMAIYTGRLDIARLARFEETTKAKPSGSPEGSAANL